MGRKISKEGSLRYSGMQELHGNPEIRGEENTCEFRDFCNRLYYIDGGCRCMTAWKRSVGLALPISG